MAFDLNTWKERLAASLQGWRTRMQGAGVDSIYAFLSALSLWPVVEAARAGEWAALSALGGVVASLGSNLLANRIQGWKDESDAARQLAADLQSEPALRAELDAVLEKLEALALAGEALQEEERAWYAERLPAELARLGSPLHVHLSWVAGDYIAGDKIAGDRIERDQYKIDVHDGGVLNLGEPGDDQRQKAEAARRRYLERLRRSCQALPLPAMGGEEGVAEEITLDSVYIELDTTTQVELEGQERKRRPQVAASIDRETDKRPLSALEAARQAPRLALLGDPGAGKSTFTHKLLAWLAAANLGECDPPPGLDADALPLLLELRDLAPRLGKLKLDDLPADQEQAKLAGALRKHLLEGLARYDAADFAPSLSQALQDGCCLLALDGLDEVPQGLRGCVRRAVAAVLREYGPRRVIVTCRVRSYVGEALLPGFEAHTLAPFDADKIRRFTRAWYTAQAALGRLDAQQAQSRASDLAQAALTSDLRELASNPMMLTAMAIIHQGEVGLPSERVRLYDRVVEVLSRRWQKHKVGERGLADFLKDDLRLRAALERLAYQAHRGAGKGREAVDLQRGVALTLLEAPEYLGDPGLAAEFLDYVDQRSGLLIGRGGEPGRPLAYSFPHRTFQEYLAGQRELARAFYTHAGEGDAWSLAAQLAAEELYYNRRSANTLLDLAYRLCPAAFPADERGQRALLWSGQIAALLGRELIARDQGSPDGGPRYLERILPYLVALLGSERLPAVERAEAGRALASLGDLRFRADLWFLPDEPRLGFVEIPAGPFRMGSDKQRDPQAYDDELPQHEVNLPAYYIARYPVTVAQFEAFTRAGGYAERRFWSEAIRAGRWQDGHITRRAWDYEKQNLIQETAQGPHSYGAPFDLPNHPVVGVSWYEALAYCEWLAEQLRTNSPQLRARSQDEQGFWDALAGRELTVTLPSEAQWEKAARGADGRTYPWGDEFDPDKANTSETGLGATSAVGCFPGGASPYGLLDASGNVWEWTRSLWGKGLQKPDFGYPYHSGDGREDLAAADDVGRVVRGGSWDDNERNARCAVRLRDSPVYTNDSGGFRVAALVPLSLDSGNSGALGL